MRSHKSKLKFDELLMQRLLPLGAFSYQNQYQQKKHLLIFLQFQTFLKNQ